MNQRRAPDPSVEQGLEQAVSDLQAEFGDAFSREAVAQAVADSHDSLGAYRIATYVPLLTHRFARERLRATAVTDGHADVDRPRHAPDPAPPLPPTKTSHAAGETSSAESSVSGASSP
jgi:hypothetical protein